MTASEASRSFFKLLRLVQSGSEVRVTSHGRMVAVVSPLDEGVMAERERRREAMAVLQKRWASQPPVTVGPWTREELYDRGGG